MPRYEVICPECGAKRGFMETICPVCHSTQTIGEFERALAEFERHTPGFNDAFAREFGGVNG